MPEPQRQVQVVLNLSQVTEAMCVALADAAWPMPFEQGDPAQRAELVRQVAAMIVPAVPAMVEAVGRMLESDGWLPPTPGESYRAKSRKMPPPWVI